MPRLLIAEMPKEGEHGLVPLLPLSPVLLAVTPAALLGVPTTRVASQESGTRASRPASGSAWGVSPCGVAAGGNGHVQGRKAIPAVPALPVAQEDSGVCRPGRCCWGGCRALFFTRSLVFPGHPFTLLPLQTTSMVYSCCCATKPRWTRLTSWGGLPS